MPETSCLLRPGSPIGRLTGGWGAPRDNREFRVTKASRYDRDGSRRKEQNRNLSLWPGVCLLERPRADEDLGMNQGKVPPYAGRVVMLTVEGSLALTVDALAGADKTRDEQQRKRLREQAMNSLRPVVQGPIRWEAGR